MKLTLLGMIAIMVVVIQCSFLQDRIGILLLQNIDKR